MPRCRPIRSLINQVRSFCTSSKFPALDHAVESTVAPMQRAARSVAGVSSYDVEALEKRQLGEQRRQVRGQLGHPGRISRIVMRRFAKLKRSAARACENAPIDAAACRA